MKQTNVVFISLIIDLFAFTLILPLLPKLFDYYETNKNDSFYTRMENVLNNFRVYFVGSETRGFNSVLFGGLIGSLFSFLQFVSSAFTGALSDIYGRKPILLATMIGTLLSYIIWSNSTIFLIFLLSRIIGGISKSNISLCISIMTDLTDAQNRSHAMALVGIAFSLGFLIGPLVGGIFSTLLTRDSSTIYTYPSYLAICLNILNIFFVAKYFNESLSSDKRAKSLNLKTSSQYINPLSLFNFTVANGVKTEDLMILKNVGLANFFYLFLYSGLEFTLTFLVHKRFNYNSVQQGKMFLFIGVCMSLIQGGYVRRIKQGEHLKASIRAIYILIPSFIIIAFATNIFLFYVGLFIYSYASSIVVSCLTVIVSNFGNDDEKGAIMGTFRSLGALARSFGPLATSLVYWSFGAQCAYLLGSLALLIPIYILKKSHLSSEKLKVN